jgi:hypothetical protein
MKNKSFGWLFLKPLLFISGTLLFTGCEYENAEINSGVKPVSFASEISPIIISKCAVSSCHDGSGTNGDFHFFPEIKSRIDNGKFKQVVFDLKIMPPINSVSLTSTEMLHLELWIKQGAQNN